jgi:hypothetical protein
MHSRIHAQFHELRLHLRQAMLRREETAALQRAGEAAARAREMDGTDAERLVREVAAINGRLDDLSRQAERSLASDRIDIARVAPWMRPVVVLRGLATRLVLAHLRAGERRALRPRHVELGRLVAPSVELATVRARLEATAAERARWVAPYGETALPAWSADVGKTAAGLGRAVGRQLRSQLVPRGPALAGLAVGWWITRTYTDSHLRSALRSIGIGSGGTRVVSASTLEAMQFWLPLLAAALCAYAGERIAAFYAEREGGVEGGPARN